MEFYLQDSYATEHLGQLVGRAAQGGDVICLTGDLGAGKTLFSRGVAALGVAASDVNSPTFAIMNVYQGDKLEIHHFDLYRLSREEELEDIGFDEYVYGDDVVTLIEWAELFPQKLPDEYLQVKLLLEGAGRKAKLMAKGERYEQLLREVEREC